LIGFVDGKKKKKVTGARDEV